jgi:3-oxoacyl-[acyl-carrier protein] reductase
MRDAAKEEMDRNGAAAPRAIINISSTSGTHGNAGQANYAAAKAAVVGLTKTVSKVRRGGGAQWCEGEGPDRVRCNVSRPADTP